jgi:uncharacterized protein (DUF433 family)
MTREIRNQSRRKVERFLLMVAEAVTVDPEVMGGAPLFRGTTVPVQALLDRLDAGDTLDVFLAGNPTVSREQAVRFLKLAGEAVVVALDPDS